MKRNILKLLLSAAFVMCCTFSALADLATPPNNEIWYTTDNGEKLTAGKYDVGKPLCGKTIREHGEKTAITTSSSMPLLSISTKATSIAKTILPKSHCRTQSPASETRHSTTATDWLRSTCQIPL